MLDYWRQRHTSQCYIYTHIACLVNFAPLYLQALCSTKPPPLQWVLWTHFPRVLGPSRETDSSSSRGPLRVFTWKEYWLTNKEYILGLRGPQARNQSFANMTRTLALSVFFHLSLTKIEGKATNRTRIISLQAVKIMNWLRHKPYCCTVHFVESLQLLTNNCNYMNAT